MSFLSLFLMLKSNDEIHLSVRSLCELVHSATPVNMSNARMLILVDVMFWNNDWNTNINQSKCQSQNKLNEKRHT